MPNPTKAELKEQLDQAKKYIAKLSRACMDKDNHIAQLEEYIKKNKSHGKEALSENGSNTAPGKEFSMFDQSHLQSRD